MRAAIAIAAGLMLAAPPALADCAADLASVIETFKTAGPYHVEMAITGASGKAMTVSGDIDLPDKFHMVMPNAEMIMLGDKSWVKHGGTWMAMPAGAAAMMQGQIKQGMDSGNKNRSNAQCLGEQSYRGKTVTAYSYDSSSSFSGITAHGHVQMYADPDSHLPLFMTVDGEAMGHKSTTEQSFTYDKSIVIAPPN